MFYYFFPVTLFLSAGLLFIIQPMVAKVLLPIYGGMPAVWTICMLFFQISLLLAYAYAWLLSRLKVPKHWRWIHISLCLLSMLALPLTFLPMHYHGVPELGILINLVLKLGLPLFIVASSAPLLQFAFSQTINKQARDPYYLYVASNVGSLLALLSYPLIIERYTGIQQQFVGWNSVYALYLLLLMGLLFFVKYEPLPTTAIKSTQTGVKQALVWVLLSFIPCSMMLGVTFYISTDLASTPLFWVFPLSLYLLSFVLTFSRKPFFSEAWVNRHILTIQFIYIVGFIVGPHVLGVIPLIFLNLLGFFAFALLCHRKLVASRPPVGELTVFYFFLALGGVLAGLFNGILAPRLFSYALEYPLLLLLAITSMPYPKNSAIKVSAYCGMTILLLLMMVPSFRPLETLSQQRNFYGVKRVFSQAGAHVLMSQNTLHGFQLVSDANVSNGSTAYYGGMYNVVKKMMTNHASLEVMVLGLGAGTMARQFRAEDRVTMVEIDEQMINIASNPNYFTYLRDSEAHLFIKKGDGRLAVQELKDASLDLLVMDAFNSDAIPIHLLTLQALTMYKQKINPAGIILVNISNRHLNVLPILTGAGRVLDMIVLHQSTAGNNRLGQFASEWVLLTTNEALAMHLMQEQDWYFVADTKTAIWTDDYSNIVPLLKWNTQRLIV